DCSVAYVLDRYRAAELVHALDVFVALITEAIAPAELCAQLLGRLFGAASPSALWLLTRVAQRTKDLGRTYQSAFHLCVDSLGPAQPTGGDSDDGSSDGRYAVDVSECTLGVSMVLDVVAAVAPAAGPSIAYYLDTQLFPLLQTLASTPPLLRSQARRALVVLAQTTPAESVAVMLQANVDYTFEGCSRQIRSVALHPHVFEVLTGAVRLVGRDILPYMDDVVEDTLDACEAAPYGDSATSALQFLEAVTRTIAGDGSTRQIEARCASLGMLDSDPIGSAIAEMADMDEKEVLAEIVMLDDEDGNGSPETQHALTDSDTQEGGDGAAAAGDPLAIKIALSVQGFLSSNSVTQQFVALKTVSNALGALKTTCDRLPLINEVWPLLVRRLAKDHDALDVVIATCDVVETVCALGST
ncbi:hypothetical protein LPJ61_004551, partial [Coemansia biformis]